MPNAVKIRNAWFSYGGTPIIEGVTISVAKGDFLGIIGPNGGGKTTLLKLMLGLLEPSKGTIRIFGKPPCKARDMIGYVPQTPLFDREFPISAFDVVLMGRLSSNGLGRGYTGEDREKTRWALEKVGMGKHAQKQASRLSGGQLQRVLVARAIASEPKLLLLDEPLSSVDPEAQKAFYELLGKLQQDMAIVMVTHDISAASTHIKKIACLNGRLYYHGSAKGGVKSIEKAYRCPIELIAHGMPHRVLKRHD